MRSKTAASFVIVSVMFLLVSTTLLSVPLVASSSAEGQRLGYWLQEGDIMGSYPASTFFNAMFLTPPYPSSIEVMIFAITQAESSSQGCSSSGFIGASENYWGQVAQMADSYPSIRLVYEIAFDPTNGGSGTYGLSCYDAMVQSFAQYPSVYAIGVEGEYTRPATALTLQEMQTAMGYVTGAGKQFVNYYVPVNLLPSGSFDIYHTNFPGGDAGGYGQVGELTLTDPHTVGMDSGYYTFFNFPGTVSCPIGASAMNAQTAAWNQCVEQTEISTAVSMPTGTRQFLEIDAGFDGITGQGIGGAVFFTGVSGLSTYQLWDSPTLRNWIWTDPNYQPNFILSTTPATTTSSSSSTSTTTSSTTSTTTSRSTSTTTSTSTSTTTSRSTSTTTSTSTSTTSSTSTSTSSSAALVSLATRALCPPGVQSCGSVSPAGSKDYLNGTSVALMASASTGYNFTSWHICAGSCQIVSANPMHLTLTADTKATALFEPDDNTTTTTTTATTATTTTSSSSTTTTNSTTSTTSSTESTFQPTSTFVPPHTSSTPSFALTIESACPTTGAGSYFSGSTAIVNITATCDRNGNSGLRVTSWSLDGGSNVTVSTNGTVGMSVTMDAPHTVSVYTTPQYSLTLDYGAQVSMLSLTPPTIAGDYYWYDSGTVVTFMGQVALQGYTVAGWAVDGGNPVSISGVPDFTTSFVMGGPHTLHVLLEPNSASCGSVSCGNNPVNDVTIQTDTKLPSGVWVDGAYYPKSVSFAWQTGSVHNITAIEGGRLASTRTSFTGWSGESDSSSLTIMLTVNETGYLTADYSKEYLVTLAFTDEAGSPISPQSVTLTGPTGAHSLGPNLTAWVEPSTRYAITSAIWMNWNVIMSNDSTFVVSQPSALTFPTSIFTQTVKVTDVYNLPLQGAIVNITTLNGVDATAVTDAQGIAQFRIPVGLFSASVQYLGVSDQITSSTEGSHSYTVSFLLSYPLVGTLVAVSAITATLVFFRLRRKKPLSGLQFFSD